MLVLGIETTCDETAAAVVERHDDGRGYHRVQRGAVADRRTCGLRRRGAGNRGARPCGGARPHHRDCDGGRRPRVRRSRRRGGGGRSRADRRRHRRPDHRQGDCDRARKAADRRQPSRGPRPDGAADRRHIVSLLPVSRLRRPYPDRRGARRRRLRAPRHHARRRDRRGVRQDREAARPRLSGRARASSRRPRAATAGAFSCRAR